MTITVKVEYDSDASNPRTEYDNVGTMVCWHPNYVLGDEQPKCEPRAYLEGLPAGSLILPLFLYDHSGITISTGAFGDPWDSGQVGFIYVTPEIIRKEWGDDFDKAKEYLESEVKVYDDYLTGRVYGFVIAEHTCCGSCGHSEPSEIDSCWGFYGHDALEAMKDYVDSEHHAALTEAWENV